MADNDTCLLESILESFEEIGYDGPLSDKEQLRSATNEALGSVAFIDLIEMLCTELNILLSMDESVTRPSGPNDFESFCMEMRSFVSELGCPHRPLTDDLAALYQLTNKLALIDFLVSQLMAARLIYLRKQKKKQGLEDDLLNVNPYSVAGNLAAILRVYGVSKPPSHVTVSMVLDKIITKTKELVSSAPPEYITPSLVTQGLTPEQWGRLDQINEALTEEYALRRRMLLTRCNVTVKSFKWSDKAKDKEEEFSSVYQKRLVTMPERAPILIAKVLATKKDILSIERTSSGSVRKNTECDVNKVLMGNVPDRGGRPNETRPPPEMPSFKKRTEPSPQEKRERGGHKGGKRGGRVQGGWSGGGGKGSGGGGYQGDWSGSGQFDNNGAHWQQDSRNDYQGGYQGADYGGYQGGYQGNDYGGYQGGHGGYQGGHGGYQGGAHGANQRGRGGRGGGQYQRQYSAQNPRQNNSGRPHPQRQYSDQQYYYS